MFRAIGRLFRTLGYLFTGQIDKISNVWASKPTVIGATYDQIMADKRNNLQIYKNAVAGMITQEEKKRVTVKDLTDQIKKHEQIKAGALAKAKLLKEKLGEEALKSNPEYATCLAAFNDASSTLTEKNARILELEKDIEGIVANIANHKVQMQTLLREIQNLAAEKHETIADIISAQEEAKIADMLSGISVDKSHQELQRMRDMRTEIKAGARVSRELAGNDVSKIENEFLDYASKAASNSEFEQLLGIAKETATEVPVESEPTKIPE